MVGAIRVGGWDDWVRVYGDVSVWRGLIGAICEREGIGFGEIESARANTNAVFLLDRAFALKIYSPFWDEFEMERALLERLGSEEGIPVPELVGSGRIADGDGVVWAYLITRYCAARPFSEIRGELSAGEAASVAVELGRIVGRLHALDPGRFGDAAPARVWRDVVSERRRSAAGELVAAGVLDDAIAGPLEALLDGAIGSDLAGSRVVAHGDLGGDHVLCARDGEGWRIAALIDFGDAKIGVREYEWMPVWMGFCEQDAELARAFLDGYDARLLEDSAFAGRAAAWSVLHDFGSDELIRQWQEGGQARPIETIAELEALLCPGSIFG